MVNGCQCTRDQGLKNNNLFFFKSAVEHKNVFKSLLRRKKKGTVFNKSHLSSCPEHNAWRSGQTKDLKSDQAHFSQLLLGVSALRPFVPFPLFAFAAPCSSSVPSPDSFFLFQPSPSPSAKFKQLSSLCFPSGIE